MVYFMEMNVGKRHEGEEERGSFAYWKPPRKPKLFHRYHPQGKSKWARNKVIITEFPTPNQTFFKIAEIALIQVFLQHELEFFGEKKVLSSKWLTGRTHSRELMLWTVEKELWAMIQEEHSPATKTQRFIQSRQEHRGSGIPGWCLRMNPQLKKDCWWRP